MSSSEEIRRMDFIEKDNIYLLYPNKIINKVYFSNNEYSSKDNCLTKQELYNYLNSKNFFK